MFIEHRTERRFLKRGFKRSNDRDLNHEECVEARRKVDEAYSDLVGEKGVNISWTKIEGVINAEKRLIELNASDLDIIQLDLLENTNLLTYKGLRQGANFFYRRAADFSSSFNNTRDHSHNMEVIRKIGACYDAGDFLKNTRI